MDQNYNGYQHPTNQQGFETQQFQTNQQQFTSQQAVPNQQYASQSQMNIQQCPSYQQAAPMQPMINMAKVKPSDLGKDFTPIGAWGYFGYGILFSIPLVGFILLLVFSLGGTNNVNLRNFARSYFCALVLLIIIYVFLAALGLSAYSIFSN